MFSWLLITNIDNLKQEEIDFLVDTHELKTRINFFCTNI